MRRGTQFSNASKNIKIIWRMNKKIVQIQSKTNVLVFFKTPKRALISLKQLSVTSNSGCTWTSSARTDQAATMAG